MKLYVKNNLQRFNFHPSSSPSYTINSATIHHLNQNTKANSAVQLKAKGLRHLARIFQGILLPVLMFFMLASLELRIGGLAKPITPAEHKYEEYYIEHEISSTQAKNSVLTFNSNSLFPPPGCQKCTDEELIYCGSSLMNDHCCCDKEYFEKLPYIPHTCYLGTQPCTPIKDCATYARLRVCCCNNILIKKWLAKNSANLPKAITAIQLLILILFIGSLL